MEYSATEKAYKSGKNNITVGANQNETSSKEEKILHELEMSEGKILKNVLLMSLTFFLLFTAYGGLASLQSSLHIQEGMGVVTQSILYGVMSFSCLFVPKLSIRFLGHKWSFTLSMIGYILWMAANGYAVWGTMVTASILVGLCASSLWTAQCAYFSIVAKKYAEMRNESVDAVNARFFGTFFAIFRLNGVAGAIIQTTVLKQGRPENSTGPSDEEIALCGLNDCPWNNITNENFEKPPSDVLWTLVGVYIGIAVLGFILASVCIDKLPISWLTEGDRKGAVKEKVFDSMGATLLHLRHVSQMLLIPLTIYSGLEQTFYGSEFYRSYITCNLGMWLISLVTLPNAVTNAITCFTTGRMVKHTGMIPVFIFAMLLDIGMQFTLLFWKPHPEHIFMYFLIPMLQGVTDGVWQTQVNALYGSLFPMESEAAFSNYRLWESFGFILAYAWSSHLCTSVKLYITMSFFYVGSALLLVVYAKFRNKAVYTVSESVTNNEPYEKSIYISKY